MTSTQNYFHLHLISDFAGEILTTVARAAAAQYAHGFGSCCASISFCRSVSNAFALRSSSAVCCAALALDRAAFALAKGRNAPT
jgi:hypothetical protein